MNSRGMCTVDSHEQVQAGSCTPQTPLNMEIRFDGIWHDEFLLFLGCFQKQTKTWNEGRPEYCGLILERDKRGARAALLSASDVLYLPPYVNPLLCLVGFSPTGIRPLPVSLSLMLEGFMVEALNPPKALSYLLGLTETTVRDTELSQITTCYSYRRTSTMCRITK